MDTTIKVQIKQAVKTENQWLTSNIIIPDGCMAISSDKSNAYKIGNGISKWSELDYNLTSDSIEESLGYIPTKVSIVRWS